MRSRVHRHAIIAILFAVAVPFGAKAQSTPELIEAAKREGTVAWYTQPGWPDFTQEALREWARRYPEISVQPIEANGPGLIERIRTEQRAGRVVADVAITADSTAWLNNDVFQPVDPARIPRLEALLPQTKSFIDPKRQFFPVSLYVYGIAVNTDKLKPEDRPRSWRDLIDAKYKGMIATDDFGRPSGGNTWVTLGLPVFGKEFYEAFGKQQLRTFGRFQEVDAALARGERAIEVPGRSRIKSDNPGAPVEWIMPSDGVYFQILVMGLVKDAPHPNAALLFMNFLLEEQMQTAIAKHDDVPVVQGVASPVDINQVPLLGHGSLREDNYRSMEEMFKFGREIQGR